MRLVFTASTRNLPNRTMLLAAPPAQAAWRSGSPDLRCRSGRSKPGSSHGFATRLSRNARTFFSILEAYRLKSRGSGPVPSVKFRKFSTLHPYRFAGLRCRPSHHSPSPQTSFMRSVFELSVPRPPPTQPICICTPVLRSLGVQSAMGLPRWHTAASGAVPARRYKYIYHKQTASQSGWVILRGESRKVHARCPARNEAD